MARAIPSAGHSKSRKARLGGGRIAERSLAVAAIALSLPHRAQSGRGSRAWARGMIGNPPDRASPKWH